MNETKKRLLNDETASLEKLNLLYLWSVLNFLGCRNDLTIGHFFSNRKPVDQCATVIARNIVLYRFDFTGIHVSLKGNANFSTHCIKHFQH